MKKIFTFLSVIVYTASAQTLTQFNNQPTSGDMVNNLVYDSVGVVPKSTGTGQVWNFSAFTTSSTSATRTFTFSSSSQYPPASVYSGATYMEYRNYDMVNFWGPGPLGFRWSGAFDLSSQTVKTDFNNDPLDVYQWPINFGTNYTAVANGSVGLGLSPLDGTIKATSQLQGSGTGTLILPVNHSCPNVLQ